MGMSYCPARYIYASVCCQILKETHGIQNEKWTSEKQKVQILARPKTRQITQANSPKIILNEEVNSDKTCVEKKKRGRKDLEIRTPTMQN